MPASIPIANRDSSGERNLSRRSSSPQGRSRARPSASRRSPARDEDRACCGARPRAPIFPNATNLRWGKRSPPRPRPRTRTRPRSHPPPERHAELQHTVSLAVVPPLSWRNDEPINLRQRNAPPTALRAIWRAGGATVPGGADSVLPASGESCPILCPYLLRATRKLPFPHIRTATVLFKAH